MQKKPLWMKREVKGVSCFVVLETCLAMTYLFLLLRNAAAKSSSSASSSRLHSWTGQEATAFLFQSRVFNSRSLCRKSVPHRAEYAFAIRSNRPRADVSSSYIIHRRRQPLHHFSSASSTNTNKQPSKETTREETYKELQWLSSEIRRHDALYYNNGGSNNKDGNTIMMGITDDDYDALVKREEEICGQYPDLQEQWERESGLGIKATRAGGRVGIDDSSTAIIASKTAVAATPRFQKRQHLVPMLSLDNITKKAQLHAWLERMKKKLITANSLEEKQTDCVQSITILTEPKLDGLSLSLRYKLNQEDNKPIYQLVWACTRGDGKQGQDVTRPIQDGMKLPSTLDPGSKYDGSTLLPEILEIRGEIVMPNSIFHELKQQQAFDDSNTETERIVVRTFSNARNAASGILLRKFGTGNSEENNATLQLQSKLSFYAYDIVVDQGGPIGLDWAHDALVSRQILQDWGFQVPEPLSVTTLDLKQTNANATNANNETILEYGEWTDDNIRPMLDYYEALGRHRDAQQITQVDDDAKSTKTAKADDGLKSKSWGDYDMDGCVHKVSHTSLRHLIGNSNRAPRWAIARKFPSQSAITSLLNIEVQVGRKTGALTPVAILEPVELAGGVTVTRATLHNFQHMQQILLYGNNVESGIANETNEVNDDMRSLLDQRQHPLLAKGSKVLVRRAGDVIPQIVQLTEPPKTVAAASWDDEDMHSKDSCWIDLAAPHVCPACGSPAVVDMLTGASRSKNNSNGESGEASAADSLGQILRCGGPPLLCPPRAVGALVHAYSRDALDISGLSEAKIQQIIAMSNSESSGANSTDMYRVRLRFPSDIFLIAQDQKALDAIAGLPGWGPKSAQNLAHAVNRVASEGVSLTRFIYSLSIRFAGIHSSKLIATAYGNVKAFLHAVEESAQIDPTGPATARDVNDNECRELKQPFAILADKENEVSKGIGPALVSSLIAFSKERELVQAAKDLANVLVVHDDEDYRERANIPPIAEANSDTSSKFAAEQPFQGMRVVFTGSLASLNLTRKGAQALAKALGAASTPTSISKTTDVVIAGEKSGGKKIDNARDFGVRIMEADEFKKLVETIKPPILEE